MSVELADAPKGHAWHVDLHAHWSDQQFRLPWSRKRGYGSCGQMRRRSSRLVAVHTGQDRVFPSTRLRCIILT